MNGSPFFFSSCRATCNRYPVTRKLEPRISYTGSKVRYPKQEQATNSINSQSDATMQQRVTHLALQLPDAGVLLSVEHEYIATSLTRADQISQAPYLQTTQIPFRLCITSSPPDEDAPSHDRSYNPCTRV